MRRISQRSQDEALEYHLKRNDTPNFTMGQAGRVELAHFLIDKILKKDLVRRPLRIVELGCGSGDITGPYARASEMIDVTTYADAFERPGEPVLIPAAGATMEIEVIGIDVVPQAKVSCGARFPLMDVRIAPVEEAEPIECDILVMCEFLEHVVDPVAIVSAWLPLAKWAVIGHPLNEPDPPFEPGHNWSYTLADWHNWFKLGNHQPWERFMFPMAAWENMVIGHSARLDQPAHHGIHPDG